MFPCLAASNSGWQAARIAGELGPIASLEFFPFGGIVAEPVAQIVAGSCVPAPGLHRQRLFLHPARPEAFYKESRAILFCGRLIYSFNLDHRHRHVPTSGYLFFRHNPDS